MTSVTFYKELLEDEETGVVPPFFIQGEMEAFHRTYFLVDGI
jgi:hypothetical protein